VNAAMGSEYNDVIAPQDVANAGVLCGLATFNRAEMQEHLIDNIDFREYLESAPQVPAECFSIDATGGGNRFQLRHGIA
jgi:hypothetical protein